MNRRRILLSYLANSFSWELYSKVYFYNELVPTTINSKNVLNKAKIVKVSGNGAIENQWCPLCFDTTYQNIVITTSNDGRKATFSGTSTGYWTYTLSFGTTIPIGRKVLVSLKIKNPNNLTFGYRLREADVTPMEYSGSDTLQLRTLTTQINCIQFYGNPDLNYTGCEIEDVQIIDLTLMFGTGNEPTTLTDNRIQNILNRGYIAFNLGKYKESDIGVVSTTKADTTALDTITFKAQLGGAINSHNTMEITNSAYVFTNAHKTIDMGSLIYGRYETDGVYRFTATISDIYQPQTYDERKENCACSKYAACQNVSYGYMENKGWIHLATLVCFRDDSYTNETDFKNAVTGATFTYKLATPQVISIPKKHLGIVDLGSLTYNMVSNSYFKCEDLASIIKVVESGTNMPNMYLANKYKVVAQSQWTDSSTGLLELYPFGASKGFLFFNKTDLNGTTYNSAAEIKSALAGIYLYYETQDEVADIENVVDIESGGTITTDSEVLPNIELSVKCK